MSIIAAVMCAETWRNPIIARRLRDTLTGTNKIDSSKSTSVPANDTYECSNMYINACPNVLKNCCMCPRQLSSRKISLNPGCPLHLSYCHNPPANTNILIGYYCCFPGCSIAAGLGDLILDILSSIIDFLPVIRFRSNAFDVKSELDISL
eukprot:Gb_19682 [translate_table: standard]